MRISGKQESVPFILENKIEQEDTTQFKEKIKSSFQNQPDKIDNLQKIKDPFLTEIENISKQFREKRIDSLPGAISKIVDWVIKERFCHAKIKLGEANTFITNFIQSDPLLSKQVEKLLVSYK
ncbi:MAG: hypothetical protein AB1414_00335 [bacterium]